MCLKDQSWKFFRQGTQRITMEFREENRNENNTNCVISQKGRSETFTVKGLRQGVVIFMDNIVKEWSLRTIMFKVGYTNLTEVTILERAFTDCIVIMAANVN